MGHSRAARIDKITEGQCKINPRLSVKLAFPGYYLSEFVLDSQLNVVS